MSAKSLSRRGFLAGSGTAALAIAGASAVLSTGDALADEATADEDVTVAEIATELGYPGEEVAPETTSYTCDVLVIGCGWAGLHAAITAADAGKNVIVVDKGKPGYSGCQPFSHGGSYWDPDYDASIEWLTKGLAHTGEYIANVDDFAKYLEGSKGAEDENHEWGIYEGYTRSASAGYENYSYAKEYFQKYALGHERHAKYVPLLQDHGVTIVDHTMITDLVVVDGVCTGAIGFAFQSSTVLSFSAKAVCMCTGPSTIKAAGFVNGGNSFDGLYAAYQAGCKIVGNEFDDFHQHSSYAPGDYYFCAGWDYEEPFGTGVSLALEESDEAVDDYAAGKASFMAINRINMTLTGLAPKDGTFAKKTERASHGIEPDENDPRLYEDADQGDTAIIVSPDAYGCAPGMGTHMCAGIYCGTWDADSGAVLDLPGLFVAGDGCKGDALEGCMYCYGGTTSSSCSYEGDRAAESAVAYADTVDQIDVPQDQIDAAREEIFAPTKLTKGFDPNQVVDQLQAIMLNPLVHINTNAAALNGALASIEYMRDNVLPNLCGYTGHDLRIAIEAKHKVFGAEMKVRAKLAREESRGMHYRSDFPYRNDDFLCHLGVYKGDDGQMAIEKIDIPDNWKGDMDADYTTRYVWRFPGEAEALGISDEGIYEVQEVHS